jgi:enoyl-CoA hydratase
VNERDAEFVQIEREGRIGRVRLNRPEKLNALNSGLVAAATRAFESLRDERQMSVVVLSGNGRAFSAGADVNEMRELNAATARTFITRLHELMAVIRDLPQVVIASIAGPCFGGACELAAACDLRIAAETARFGMPEIKVGMPSVIEAALLVPLIGHGRAADFVLTGDELSAVEAKDAGLVSRVVPADELDRRTAELAERLADYSGPALRLQKRLVREWYGAAYDAAIARGIDTFAEAFASPNPREALDAFVERRQPRFTEP